MRRPPRRSPTALQAGYRSIDTAAAYRNEKGVGIALAESGLKRDELFVTTKLQNARPGLRLDPARVRQRASARSASTFVDLYLIHWPRPARDQYLDTWRAFERLYADGRVRAIGVSNFNPDAPAAVAGQRPMWCPR